MKFLRARNFIFFAVFYLVLVYLLYHFLWQARTVNQVLEVPGGAKKAPVEIDMPIYYDDPAYLFPADQIQFNFRRNLIPQRAKAYVEQYKRANFSNGQMQTPALPHLNITHNQVPLKEPQEKLDTLPPNTPFKSVTQSLPRLNHCLHAFYYAWYGNMENDGQYMHWNHHYMPHWKASITKQYPQGRHVPPDDIGASFYPQLGCYSSKDPAVISAHMHQLRKAGVGVIAVSWYPAGMSDDEGPPPDPVIPVLLDAAFKYSIKVTLHIEPYKGRTPQSVRGDLQYINLHYTQHPAFYKVERDVSGKERLLPLIYIYDSYLSEASAWARVFKPDGSLSVRGKDYDCVAIALLVEYKHLQFAVDGGFDGVYTYFAADDFSFGSTLTNWGIISKFTREHNLIFIPSFGPGYNDLQVRPWNKMTSRDRKNGVYYREGFREALEYNRGGILSITSFNEWGEGTQIEPAVPKETGHVYLDYLPEQPEFYLQLTREMSEQLATNCSVT